MSKVLVVVDMQNDFVTGALRNEEAIKIVPKIAEKIKKALEAMDTSIIFTKDTHGADYLNTEEGKNLPVVHCVKGTHGWYIIPGLENYASVSQILEKNTFGSVDLISRLSGIVATNKDLEYIEFIGVCTDICVVSNTLLVKANFPNVHLVCDSSCCAGVTPEKHEAALEVMRSCQIEVI